MRIRVCMTAAAAGVFCAQALAAAPAAKPAAAAPAAAASPWAKVPALPTACYSSQDKWLEQNSAAFDVVQNDHYKQNDINDAIRQSATDTFGADPMAAAQRMQQAMMDDPQNAQKMMEQMRRQAEQGPAQVTAQLDKEQKIEDESKAVIRQYEAALEKAMAPGNARLAALVKKYSPPEGAGDLWLRYGEPGEPAWVRPEAHAIMKDWDQAYVATCAQWWSATGPIHAYMKRYKDFLVLERIPYEKKGDEARLDHYRQLNVSTTGWRTTTDYEAAEDYMKMALSFFETREAAPRCGPETRCQ